MGTNYRSAMPRGTPDLKVEPGRSRMLATLLLVMHLTAAAFTLMFLQPWWLAAVVAAALAGNLGFTLSRHALRLSPQAAVALQLRGRGRCIVFTRDGRRFEGSVLPSTFVSVALTVINVAPDDEGRMMSIVLLPDAAPADDLRRLRLWLKHRSAVAGADSDIN